MSGRRRPAALRLGAALLGAALLGPAAPVEAQAEPGAEPGRLADDSARAMPAGRAELGLWGPLRVGLMDELQLDVQPLIFLAMPHARLRWQLLDTPRWSASLEPGLTYPTVLLGLLSREGTLGLLPHDAEPPQALMIQLGAALSLSHGGGRVSTLRAGLEVAPRGGSKRFPVLDFPFLYPRFAALHAPLVAQLEARSEGRIAGRFDYGASATLFLLPSIGGGWAFEQGASARWRISDRFALSAGYRLTLAAYPVGIRLHVLPLLELHFVLVPG
ncbi:MAG: hypothetical protein OEY14_16265 [Myxococcales bacterium]|nr:hypothetical protein [Myxococcales bacterium]